jgi:hypothetical protein
MENVARFREICAHQGRPLTFTVTPMIHNASEIPELFEYCCRYDILLGLSILEHPANLAVWTLSSMQLAAVIASVEKALLDARPSDAYVHIWNRKVMDHYLDLLKQYLERKKDNEKNKDAILRTLKVWSSGALIKLKLELERLNAGPGNETTGRDEWVAEVEKLVVDAAALGDVMGVECLQNFLASQFTALQLIGWRQKFGDKVFQINGKRKLEDVVTILRSNSFDKLFISPK